MNRFAYSLLMARSSGSAPNKGLEYLPAILDPAIAPKLDPKETALVDEVAAIPGRLKENGSEILLVMIPPGAEAASARKGMLRLMREPGNR